MQQNGLASAPFLRCFTWRAERDGGATYRESGAGEADKCLYLELDLLPDSYASLNEYVWNQGRDFLTIDNYYPCRRPDDHEGILEKLIEFVRAFKRAAVAHLVAHDMGFVCGDHYINNVYIDTKPVPSDMLKATEILAAIRTATSPTTTPWEALSVVLIDLANMFLMDDDLHTQNHPREPVARVPCRKDAQDAAAQLPTHTQFHAAPEQIILHVHYLMEDKDATSGIGHPSVRSARKLHRTLKKQRLIEGSSRREADVLIGQLTPVFGLGLALSNAIGGRMWQTALARREGDARTATASSRW
ncbi:unnamed protein product [Vitrella brassicaformis CCMP3155]|uniref:Uncharacterized protein n=1 Tax=Vitrella brassicaformis (strain CCMP3155) TaxID=1169540 RepID=A0A0G4EID3_VITBC|nr:unnamed protein product [Vitrella brassicaformis CCMP3155]|eukprot:CEL96757.1 unnamed protein product [Vitrella brassicaformis CCMP3155]